MAEAESAPVVKSLGPRALRFQSTSAARPPVSFWTSSGVDGCCRSSRSRQIACRCRSSASFFCR
ncbi:MAG: hypothetical protein ACLS3C_11870 [Oscillospiraceae bacterium]